MGEGLPVFRIMFTQRGRMLAMESRIQGLRKVSGRSRDMMMVGLR
jgi:hypothetical protein